MEQSQIALSDLEQKQFVEDIYAKFKKSGLEFTKRSCQKFMQRCSIDEATQELIWQKSAPLSADAQALDKRAFICQLKIILAVQQGYAVSAIQSVYDLPKFDRKLQIKDSKKKDADRPPGSANSSTGSSLSSLAQSNKDSPHKSAPDRALQPPAQLLDVQPVQA